MIHARAQSRVEDAGWSLDRFGWHVNITAMIYTVWAGLFTVFPDYLPITADYMNYALPINAGFGSLRESLDLVEQERARED